jgi:geranylgeranyl diphosphate synthase, type I
MTFQTYLSSKRSHAEQILIDTFKSYRKIFNDEPWSLDVITRLETIIPKGKLMRFGLSQLGYEGYAKTESLAMERVGIALECVHTGLLFHDDIMDEDEKRRGNETLHVSYAKDFVESARNPKHFGESLAICVADFAYFIAFDFMSQTDMDADTKTRITSILAKEFSRVSLAQMQDAQFGQTPIEPTQEEIVHMYRGKTGRYSVSLPLVLGAVAGHASASDIDSLWNIGETLGVLYQIRDDALSLFGDVHMTGKPQGSDVIQNKKTLYRQHLMANVTKSMKSKLESIFGGRQLSSENHAYVLECLEKVGTIQWIDSFSSKLADLARTNILALAMSQKEKDILLDFMSFVSNRNI